MPDRVKEKLSALLYEASRGADTERYIFDQMADYLIANGVTVQGVTDTNVRSKEWGDGFKKGYEDGYKVGFNAGKWISVKDRLPEKEGRYLCVKQIGKSGAVYVQVMNGDSYGFSLEHIYHDDVTHWMPLPQPPKGE